MYFYLFLKGFFILVIDSIDYCICIFIKCYIYFLMFIYFFISASNHISIKNVFDIDNMFYLFIISSNSINN